MLSLEERRLLALVSRTVFGRLNAWFDLSESVFQSPAAQALLARGYLRRYGETSTGVALTSNGLAFIEQVDLATEKTRAAAEDLERRERQHEEDHRRAMSLEQRNDLDRAASLKQH
jgi:hypothetical protein